MVAVLRCLALAIAAAMLTCAMADLIKVGGRDGWTSNINYTEWAANHTFYTGDWLYFIFDKRYYNVLEVNKTSYDGCNDMNFVKNITRGGRDVYNLTEVRPYYFLSSGGYCYHGMKFGIDVAERPVSPINSSSLAKSAASNHIGGDKFSFFIMFCVLVLLALSKPCFDHSLYVV